jgi:hypothetical protein
MVTSNHIRLLVADTDDRDVIPHSMQLIAGRTGHEQELWITRQCGLTAVLKRSRGLEGGTC